MLSYTQRRRRWWTLLVELDPTMMISEAFRAELLLEMSGRDPRGEGLPQER